MTDTLLTEYMISGPEQANLTDWRFRKLARDYARLRSRVSRAVDGEIKPKQDQAPRKQPRKRASTVADKFNAGKMTESEAIVALIADGAK